MCGITTYVGSQSKSVAEMIEGVAERIHHRWPDDSGLLYEDLGPACVTKLDGMFAFVLSDGKQVLAARDLLGIKPLYMGRDTQGGLWFASELKALIDVCASIEEVPPGFAYSRGALQHWFEPPWREPPDQSMIFDPSAIRDRLESAVVKRLMGDVRANILEPQLAYVLRRLEYTIQSGRGCGHGLVAVLQVE